MTPADQAPIAQHLARALARALAPERKVLLAHETFDTLQHMAEAEVKELVLVEPSLDGDMPAGQTAHGAPLRMRPDWRERPSSKDLILDVEGGMPAEQVTRLLKKAGLYVTTVAAPALEALPHVTTLHGAALSGWAVGGDAHAGDVQVDDLRSEGIAHDDQAPVIYVAGKLPIDDLTGVAWVGAGGEADALREALREAQAARADAEGLVATRDGELDAARARLAEQEAELERLRTRVAAAEGGIAEAEATAEAATQELAERRIRDRRVDLAEARFDQARASLQTEIDGLRERLRAAEPEGADRMALAAARDMARGSWDRLAGVIQGAMGDLGVALGRTAPPPPPPAGAEPPLLEAWIELVGTQLTALTEEAQARGARLTTTSEALTAAEASVAAQRETLAALSTDTQAAPALTIDLPDLDAARRVKALEEALAQERALRATLDDEQLRARQTVHHVASALQSARSQLAEARAAGARARLGQAQAESQAALSKTEAEDRTRQIADLEAMVGTYRQMLGLVSQGLAHAEQDRTQAQTELAATAENLRILQGEFERHRAQAASAD
ncbi:MAG: hypothetical protein ACE366_09385 [Bradymonadia bacterium]